MAGIVYHKPSKKNTSLTFSDHIFKADGINHVFNRIKSNILWCTASFICPFLLWWLFSLALDIPIIPSPLKVIFFTIRYFKEKLLLHILYSTARILTGITISLILALPIGILMGYYNHIDKVLSPFIYSVYPIPKIALSPIILLLFGIGNLSKVLILFCIIYFQVVVSVRDAVRNVPDEVFDFTVSAGAGFKDVVVWVLLPASLPGILTSIRVSMATSLSVLFFTETFGTEYGIGYLIMDSWMRVNYIEMYSGILIVSLIGLLFFSAIDICEKHFCKF